MIFSNQINQIVSLLQRIAKNVVPNFGSLTNQQVQDGLSTVQRNSIETIYPIQTGQTISYANYDDGYFKNGRLSNFTTLKTNNIFGNTNRFTDILGGTTYTTHYVIDHATGLGWCYDLQTAATWATAVAQYGIFSLNVGGNTYTDFYLPDNNELFQICNWENNGVLNYTPFNINIGIWSSTTNSQTTTQASAIGAPGGNRVWQIATKTTTAQYVLVRKHF